MRRWQQQPRQPQHHLHYAIFSAKNSDNCGKDRQTPSVHLSQKCQSCGEGWCVYQMAVARCSRDLGIFGGPDGHAYVRLIIQNPAVSLRITSAMWSARWEELFKSCHVLRCFVHPWHGELLTRWTCAPWEAGGMRQWNAGKRFEAYYSVFFVPQPVGDW